MPGGRPRIHPKPGSNRAWVSYLVPWDREGNLVRHATDLPRNEIVWKANATFKATLRPMFVHWPATSSQEWYEFRDYFGHTYPMFREQADELHSTGLSGRPTIYGLWDAAKASTDAGVAIFGVRLVAIL